MNEDQLEPYRYDCTFCGAPFDSDELLTVAMCPKCSARSNEATELPVKREEKP